MNIETGDVGYVQKTLPHFVENTGTTDLKFLEMLKTSNYQDLAHSKRFLPHSAGARRNPFTSRQSYLRWPA